MISKHALSTGKIPIKLWDFQRVKGCVCVWVGGEEGVHRIINLQLSKDMTLTLWIITTVVTRGLYDGAHQSCVCT